MSLEPGSDFGANWGVNGSRLRFGFTMGTFFCEKPPFLPTPALILAQGVTAQLCQG